MTHEEWDKLTPNEQWNAYQRLQGPVFHWMTPPELGNPMPIFPQGDMIPILYDGEWWYDWSAYCACKRAHGEEP